MGLYLGEKIIASGVVQTSPPSPHCGQSYFTEETLTSGTWIDGRPVYQITIVATANGQSMQMIASNIPKDAQIVSVSGILDFKTSAISHQYIAIPTSNSYISIDTREGDFMTIHLDTSPDSNGSEMYINVQYVKPVNS